MSAFVRPPCDEQVIRCAPVVRCRPHSPTWVLVAAILGSSIAFIDATVVNVALPAIQVELHASAVDAQWVVEVYALLLSALILVGGALGDRLGRRRVFGTGVAIFAVASLLCGIAQSPGMLIATRALQGVGGALLTPGSLALISASYSGASRGRAIGTWSAFTVVTSAAGPVLGGLLVEHVSWRAAFLINLPLAAVVLVICVSHVPESRDETVHGRLDLAGALLASLGLGGVVYGLLTGQTAGMGSPVVLASLGGGVLMLALFVLIERRAEAPMMPLALFRSRAFSATNALTFLLYGALGGAFFFVPLVLIEVHGYSPAAAGASLLPMTLLLFLLSRFSGGLITRTGARLPLTVGPLIAACGFVLLALPGTGGSYVTTFLPAAVVLGLGMAITVAPLTTTVMGSVADHYAGVASGVNNAVARTAGLIAVAVLGLVVVGGFQAGLGDRLDRAGLAPPVRQAVEAQESKLALARAPAGTDAATASAVQDAVQDAFVSSYRVAALIAGGLAALSALTGLVGMAPRRPVPEVSRAPAPAPAGG